MIFLSDLVLSMFYWFSIREGEVLSVLDSLNTHVPTTPIQASAPSLLIAHIFLKSVLMIYTILIL